MRFNRIFCDIMEMIKELMGLGILVEPDVADLLKTLDNEKIKIIIERSKTERPLILTNDIIESFLKQTSFKILKTMERKKSFTVQDMVDKLNARYDFIQNLLMRKIELSNIVSINKCTNGKLTVIGIVKSKEKSDSNIIIELEDKTGTIKTVVSTDIGKKVDLDDVIAVHGNYNNKLLFGEKIFYPDIPLRRVSYSGSDTKIAFVINHDFSKKLDLDADYIFIGNCDNQEVAKEHYSRSRIFFIDDSISNPALVEVDGIVILILFNSDPLDSVKKRFISINNNDFLIDSVPDIILTNKDVNTNYKGISIVGNKSVINLKTREITNL